MFVCDQIKLIHSSSRPITQIRIFLLLKFLPIVNACKSREMKFFKHNQSTLTLYIVKLISVSIPQLFT